MGSVCETIEETINHMNAKGEKVGLIKVRLYRPFVKEYFMNVLPVSGKEDRCPGQDQGAWFMGEPLYQDVKTLLFDEDDAPKVYGGRYGLGSNDTNPGMIEAVYANLAKEKHAI